MKTLHRTKTSQPGQWFSLILVALLLLLITIPVLSQSGGGYDLTWSTVDGGGVMSSGGGSYTLAGTIGQPDAGDEWTGGRYALWGGFWGAATAPPILPSHPIYLPLVSKSYNPSLAELILHNGRLLTMEGASWDAQAIAVRGDRILAAGSDADVLALQGPQTQVIDL